MEGLGMPAVAPNGHIKGLYERDIGDLHAVGRRREFVIVGELLKVLRDNPDHHRMQNLLGRLLVCDADAVERFLSRTRCMSLITSSKLSAEALLCDPAIFDPRLSGKVDGLSEFTVNVYQGWYPY